jgi:hypothetical protein
MQRMYCVVVRFYDIGLLVDGVRIHGEFSHSDWHVEHKDIAGCHTLRHVDLHRLRAWARPITLAASNFPGKPRRPLAITIL